MVAPHKSKQRVSIVGSGRLGTALAIALSNSGFSIEYLVTRHIDHARKAARLLDVPVRSLAAKDLDKLPLPELLFITTPDDQIAMVVGRLARLTDTPRSTTVLHTSGALSSNVLTPLGDRGWHIGSIHPLISVSDPKAGADSLRGCYWCIEGDKSAIRLAKGVVRDLEGRSFTLESKMKPLYHAAAVMASGNVVVLFEVALGMLVECGLSRIQARRILLPLLESTVRNLAVRDPARALTGTFARGDLETVQRHLGALDDHKLKDASELYRLLGLRALQLAQHNGLDPALVKRIARTLRT